MYSYYKLITLYNRKLYNYTYTQALCSVMVCKINKHN